ncbi:TPA: sorbitol dehydrogenase [Pseudomonas putida]|uniref:sorbitol dehydrogenase n=1 Tax=Pseudomonas putida TaxID=303 RepID=UPI00236326C5|nr:sorbitol dehydrogenase [Pseudomonas putida]MDD2011515.1 sorbitol dehydrogenase [Pseudomonas putida]HDS1778609.1 sorbitol dehydrogenase [Pseudomonas putida]
MSDQNLQNFIGLSAVLTGLSAKLLAPSVDPINLPPVFFATAQQGMGLEAFSSLLELYASIQSQPPAQIASAVLDNANPQIAQGARSIMKLWLLGSWYQPYDLGSARKGDTGVVSDQAYKESWAWKIAQSHPMGYSQFHFGYWGEQPPTLKQFTGVDAKEGQQP